MDYIDLAFKSTSLLIGIGTFILVIIGFRTVLRNQLRTKQLDVVYQLIEQIQKTDWQLVHFHNFDPGTPKYLHLTLFDVVEIDEFNTSDKLYFWGIDTEQLDESLFEWQFFFKYYSHPLLPKSIAIALKKFNLWRPQKHIYYDDVKDDRYIAIGRKKNRNKDSYYFYFTEGDLSSCQEFKKSVTELRNEIIKWAKKYKLKDLNITTSHASQRFTQKSKN